MIVEVLLASLLDSGHGRCLHEFSTVCQKLLLRGGTVHLTLVVLFVPQIRYGCCLLSNE